MNIQEIRMDLLTRIIPFLLKRGYLQVVALLLAVSMLSGCSLEYDGEPWTYLVYMHADNNLDKAAVADIEEMLEAEGPGMRFIVQVDRSPEYGKRSLRGLSHLAIFNQ